jgi:hypothetical protein
MLLKYGLGAKGAIASSFGTLLGDESMMARGNRRGRSHLRLVLLVKLFLSL